MIQRPKSVKFPDPLAREEKKRSVRYGLQFVQAMCSEWYGSGHYSTSLHPRKLVENLRYRHGVQSPSRYKKMIGEDHKWEVDQDISLINLDYQATSVGPNLVNSLLGEITRSGFSVQLEAIDVTSQSYKIKEEYRARVYRQMVMSGMMKELEAKMGGNSLGPDELQRTPLDLEEFEMFLEDFTKLPLEIAPKTVTDKVLFVNNEWDYQWPLVCDDVLTYGIGATITKEIKGEIVVERSEPIYGIFDPSTLENNKDSSYYGWRNLKTPADLKHEFGEDALTKDQWRKVYDKADSQTWRYNQENKAPFFITEATSNGYEITEYQGKGKVEVVYFYAKVEMGSSFSDDLSNSRNPFLDSYEEKDDEGRKEGGRVWYETVFQGCYLPDCELMLEWKECEFVSRNPSSKVDEFSKCDLPVSIYSIRNTMGIIRGVVDMLRPLIDEFMLFALKEQLFVKNAAPPGYAIDQMALAGVIYSKGETNKYWTPKDLQTVYIQTGIQYLNIDEETGRSTSLPIQPLDSTFPVAELNIILAKKQEISMQMREITGISHIVDGTGSDSSIELVGVRKMQLDASVNPIQQYLTCISNIAEDTYQTIIRWIQAISRRNGLKDFLLSISAAEIEVVNAMNDFSLQKFGIRAEFFSNMVYENQYNQALVTAQQYGGLITPADIIELNEIDDPKKRSMRLRKRIMQNQKAQKEHEMKMAQVGPEAQAKADAQRMGMEHKNALEVIQAKAQAEVQIAERLARIEVAKVVTVAQYDYKGKIESATISSDTQKEVQAMKDKAELEQIEKKGDIDAHNSKTEQ